MADLDLAQYMRERMSLFDPTLDTSAGSAFDTRVVQPLLRRLGSDPFTLDSMLYAETRVRQEFPDLALEEGAALRDVIIKAWNMLSEPVRREVVRVRQGLSLQDPDLLTLEEATALGANLVKSPKRGSRATGRVRLYYTAPRDVSVGPNNSISNDGGTLRFFPLGTQSIRADEMLFNTEGTRYYFDVTAEAEFEGTAYNVDPGALRSIRNVSGVTLVTNKSKFRGGIDADSAVSFVGRINASVAARSLDSLPGIRDSIGENFPDVVELAVTGLNDPEMQRDVLRGGGLGEMLASGVLASALDDAEGRVNVRRVLFDAAEVDLVTLLASAGPAPSGLVLTLHDAFPDPPQVRDLAVATVVGPQMLDLEESVLDRAAANVAWSLRRRSLALSEVPGGILQPDLSGYADIPPDEVHIGGCVDVFVRASAPDELTLVLESVEDDRPVAQGIAATLSPTTVTLTDLVLGTDYAVGDALYNQFAEAVRERYRLLLEGNPGVNGTYALSGLTQTPGASPVLTLASPPTPVAGNVRWRLVDRLDVDLVEPRRTWMKESDLRTIPGSGVLRSITGLVFANHGVGVGDTVRILGGLDAGDYTVTVLGPFPDTVTVTPTPSHSGENLGYEVFRPNPTGGVVRPCLRITRAELLDGQGKTTGTLIPPADIVLCRSRSFANLASGTKVSLADAQLGLVSQALPPLTTTLNGRVLRVKVGGGEEIDQADGSLFTVSFVSASMSPEQIVDAINAASVLAGHGQACILLDATHIGFFPIRGTTEIYVSGQYTGGAYTNDSVVLLALFGDSFYRGTTRDVRSATITALGGRWLDSSIQPPLHTEGDVVSVLDGYTPGHYPAPLVDGRESNGVLSVGGPASFLPQLGRQAVVGGRSIGSARLHFLEPTSCTVDARRSRFTYTQPDGSTLAFLPDPTLSRQLLPAAPSTTAPKDGALLVGTDTFESVTGDFLSRTILPGDLLEVSYIPGVGSVALPDEVLLAANTTLILSFSGGPDVVLTVYNDDSGIAPTSVTRDGLVEQLNSQAGGQYFSINALFQLEMEADIAVTLRGTGTLNPIVGFPGVSTPNAAAQAGTYPIVAVLSATQLTLDNGGSTFSAESRLRYRILRPGSQRTPTTVMATQVDPETGLYYADVELVSEGTGNTWNIGPNLDLVATEVRVDGYRLHTDKEPLSFSPVETLSMELSRSILENGSTDDPLNERELTGAEVQLTYASSELVSRVHDFLQGEDRAVNSNMLGRHLHMHLVSVGVTYTGGPTTEEATAALTAQIEALAPDAAVQASALQKTLLDLGATSVQNPLSLVALAYLPSRVVQGQFSPDRLTTGRLSAFQVLRVTATRSP